MQRNFFLAILSNYKTGGPADYFFNAKNIGDIKSTLAWADANNQKVFILGSSTNILFPDAGWRGLVLKINNNDFRFEGEKLFSGAGTLVSSLIEACIERELTGLEWAGGLPGTLGGAIRGNAGCFGGEIKDAVESVTAVNFKGQSIIFNNQECRFAYRHSRFKEEKLIVTEVVLNLKKDLLRKKIAEIAQSHINYRKEKQPLEFPNCGSVFKNVPVAKAPAEVAERFKDIIKTDPFLVIPTAALIDQSGLKGFTIGGAQVSPKHPNFIINAGGATSDNILAVINHVKKIVKNKFNVDLDVEIELV